MAKDALPSRYVVDRKGTPDPESSEYYVLDLVHDRHARTVLGSLIRYYRQYEQTVAADELEKALADTVEAHADVIRERYAAANPKVKKTTTRSRSRR